MTIVNVLIHGSYATIITDTKATMPFGEEFHVSKVRPIPHMRLAIATRGRLDAVDKIAAELGRHAYDFASSKSFLELCFAGLELGPVDVFVAGYDGGKPAAFMVSNVNSGGKIIDIPYLMTTPQVSDEDFAKFSSDPVGGLLEFVQAQCRADNRCGGWINVSQIGPAVIETYTAGVAA